MVVPWESLDPSEIVVGAVRLRAPVSGRLLARLACHERDPVGDHERRVESDAEAPDQLGHRLRASVIGQGLQHLLSARAGDGSNVVDDFLPRHADAVVTDREGSLVGVWFEADFEFLAFWQEVRPP